MYFNTIAVLCITLFLVICQLNGWAPNNLWQPWLVAAMTVLVAVIALFEYLIARGQRQVDERLKSLETLETWK